MVAWGITAVFVTGFHQVVNEAIDVKFQIRVTGRWFYVLIGFADGKILGSPSVRNTVPIGICRLFFIIVQRPSFHIGL